jgi:hypothetical protein
VVNFQVLLKKLHIRGRLSYAEIARRVGAESTTIVSLANGHTTEPRYNLGAALVELHEEVFAK